MKPTMENRKFVGKHTRAQEHQIIMDRYRKMKQRDAGESITPRRVRKEESLKVSTASSEEEDSAAEESAGASSSKRRRMKRSGGVWKRSDESDSDPDFIILGEDGNRDTREKVARSDEPDFGEGTSRATPSRKPKPVFGRILIGEDSSSEGDFRPNFGEGTSGANPISMSKSVFIDDSDAERIVIGDDSDEDDDFSDDDVGPSVTATAAEDDVPSPSTEEDDVDLFSRGWNRKSESKKSVFGESSKKHKASTFNESSRGGSKRKNSWGFDSGEKVAFDSFETKVFRDLEKILKKSGAVQPKSSGLKTRFQVELDDEDDDDGLADNSGFGAFRDRVFVSEEELRKGDFILKDEIRNGNSVFEEEIKNCDSSSESHVSSSETDYDDSQDEDFKIGMYESSTSLVKTSSDEEEFEPEENDLIAETFPSKTTEKVDKKPLEKEDHNQYDFGVKGSENGSVKAEISGARVADKATTIFEEEVESKNVDDKNEGFKDDERTPGDEDAQNHDNGENVSVGSVTGQMKAVIPEAPSSPVKIPTAESVVIGKMGNENVASNDNGVTFPLEIKAGMKSRERKRGDFDTGKGSRRTSQEDYQKCGGDNGSFVADNDDKMKKESAVFEKVIESVKTPIAAEPKLPYGVASLEIKTGMRLRQRNRGNFDAGKGSCRTSQGTATARVTTNDAKKRLRQPESSDVKIFCKGKESAKTPLANEPTLPYDKEVAFQNGVASMEIRTGMKSRARKRGNFDAGKGSCRNSQDDYQKCGGDNGGVVTDNDADERVAADNDAKKRSPQPEFSDASELHFKAIFEKGKESAKTPPVDEPPLPLKFFFPAVETKPEEKSDYELELDNINAELDLALQYDDMGSIFPPDDVEDEESDDFSNEGFLCSKGKHSLFLDEEIGIRCKICSYVEMEIKYHVPPVTKYITVVSGKRIPLDEEPEEEDFNILEGFEFPKNMRESGNISNHTKGTVWDIIPGIKNTMYEHQQEGFEFIWTNLEGTMNLNELKISNSNNVGGCIISHAPGTGKTRLTIVFLQSYLQLFPVSRPVIIAPASMLLTWEEEFRKWDLGVPFHNLNNLLEPNGKLVRNADLLRIAKLKQWINEKSILGISYSLYEKFVGEKTPKSVKDNKMGKWVKEETEALRRILLEFPGVLVLDEGHTPRNERSRIWKALNKVETKRRIILSGTPFQNNFGELYNILCLVRPEFADQIPSRLKKFCHTKAKRKRGYGAENEKTLEQVCTDRNADIAIEELKGMIAPFVHLHKGSILKESLPGLKDCVVVLNPASELQKRLVTNIQCPPNTFEFEHVLAMSTVHPSLLLQTPHYKDLDDELEEIKFDPNEGSKTRFLMEIIRLSVAMNEKVLVFSQYIDPLNLIKDQLASIFNWTEGKEMLQMQGRLDQGLRQTMINIFNNPNNESRVMLASTKACSEGISLVGASRVVLLDVVWNPSVERQAISRAYRIGQKKVVYTYHLIMSGTAEWDKYCKQTAKDRLSELVFSEADKENEKQKASLELSEDRILDEMISHVKLKEMFERIIYQPKEIKLIETFT